MPAQGESAMNTRIHHFLKSSKSWPKAIWSWCRRCLDKCQPYEKEILISFLFFCAGFITGWMLRSFYEGRADAETIRNAILIIGGLMAFYGLVQATKRQKRNYSMIDWGVGSNCWQTLISWQTLIKCYLKQGSECLKI